MGANTAGANTDQSLNTKGDASILQYTDINLFFVDISHLGEDQLELSEKSMQQDSTKKSQVWTHEIRLCLPLFI